MGRTPHLHHHQSSPTTAINRHLKLNNHSVSTQPPLCPMEQQPPSAPVLYLSPGSSASPPKSPNPPFKHLVSYLPPVTATSTPTSTRNSVKAASQNRIPNPIQIP